MNNIYKKYGEIINYLIVGFLTTIISLMTYYICTYTFLNPSNSVELQLANIISWTLAVIFAYLVNRKYVFKSNNKNKKKEISLFISSRLLTLIIDMLLMYLFVTLLHYNDKLIKVLVQIFVILSNYLISKLIVFKKSS